MKDVYITKQSTLAGAGWLVSSYSGDKMQYVGYTKREALKKWREKMGLKYKHLNIIEY